MNRLLGAAECGSRLVAKLWGGNFLFKHYQELEKECIIRGVSFEITAISQSTQLLNEIAHPEVNQDVVKLEKIAVYSPKSKQPWDDAVTYSEIPYDIVYDEEVLNNTLPMYDWLHLHHRVQYISGTRRRYLNIHVRW